MRAPFLGYGLTMDEGGYAYLARAWAHGGSLYHRVWVDRPEGLLLLYRLLLLLGGGVWAVRVGAVAAGAAVTLALYAIGSILGGRRLGYCAAGLFALAGLAPSVQAFAFNGELAAAPFACGAVALALDARRRAGDGDGRRWVAAGLLAACGPLVKQSAFDGLVVALVIAASTGAGRGRARRLGLVLAGVAIPVAVALAHALTIGFGSWWTAVVGYRLGAQSGGAGGLAFRLDHLGRSLLTVQPELGPLAVAALAGAIVCWRRRQRIAFVWTGAALLGFNVGALYWPHYYVQLLPPLCLLAAYALDAVPGRVPAAALGVLVLSAPALASVAVYDADIAGGRSRSVPYIARWQEDERVAAWLRARTTASQPVLALYSEAGLYFLADRPPAVRYLWATNLREIHGALGDLCREIASNRPRFVVVYASPSTLDRSGTIARALAAGYTPVRNGPRVPWQILRPLGGAGRAPPSCAKLA